MCGRYNLRTSAQVLAEMFHAKADLEVHPRYNIAPTQSSLVCRLDDAGQREIVPMRWGLVPSWAKDIKIGYKLINARAETVSEKPSFRAAYKRRRCLVIASGFYEWKREGKSKQPFHIHREDDQPFAFAGLWEYWDQGAIESFTIITTAANSLMVPIHHRMPVLLQPDQYGVWLDQDIAPQALEPLLEPYDWKHMQLDPANSNVGHEK